MKIPKEHQEAYREMLIAAYNAGYDDGCKDKPLRDHAAALGKAAASHVSNLVLELVKETGK